MTDAPKFGLDVQEQLAHISQLNAEANRRRQEFELGYRTFWITAIAAATALLGAGAAVGGLIVALLLRH